MKQTLLMERVLDQTRLAVIEDDRLCELYIQRPDAENLSGNIYLGRVENVLPGMNAAFVDIGLDKNGFLAADDIRLPAQGDRELSQALGRSRIEKLVRSGQQVLVQVVRSQPGAKGPRLSCHLTLPGRTMVLLAGVPYVGVSRKIGEESERERLRRLGQEMTEGTGSGLILRTAARGADPERLRAEYEHLVASHAALLRAAQYGAAPKLVYDDADLVLRSVRDMLNEGVDALWTDDPGCHARLTERARALAPDFEARVRLHEGDIPLFDLYRVDAQLDKALQKYVWLKSGGSLVIEETEALTSVDVNTGKNVGRKSSDETILAANCEAARELVRQLRLRDVGGIIIADFIDMRREEDRRALLDVLRECAAGDRENLTVVDMTPLGLVELTRKRTRQSLVRQLTHTCDGCGGNGRVPSHEFTARRALRELWRRRRGGDETPLALEAASPVCGWAGKLGMPGGGRLALKPTEGMGAGEYRLVPCEKNNQ